MENIIENVAAAKPNKADDPIEKCVLCGANTPYRLSTPISQREFYMEGSGQMCRQCHYEIYIKKNR